MACVLFWDLRYSCSAAQREKALDKQLHGIIEQLAVNILRSLGSTCSMLLLLAFKMLFITIFKSEKLILAI